MVDLSRAGKARGDRMKRSEGPEGFFPDLILQHLVDGFRGLRLMVFVPEADLIERGERVEQGAGQEISADGKQARGFHEWRAQIFQIAREDAGRRFIRRRGSQGRMFEEKKGDSLVAIEGGWI